MNYQKQIVREPARFSRWEARMALRDRVKPAILLGFLFTMVVGLPAVLIEAFVGLGNLLADTSYLARIMMEDMAAQNALLQNILPGLSVLMLYYLLVSGPFQLAKYMLYLRFRRRQEGGAELLFSGFNNFGRALRLYLLTSLLAAAWALLIYVPVCFLGAFILSTGAVFPGFCVIFGALLGGFAMGIVKMMQYGLSFFILVDNPEIRALEAIRSSTFLMAGNKARLFLLNLSFIGWYLLAGIAQSIILTPFSFASSGLSGDALSLGWQVLTLIASTLATGIATGFVQFYNGIATAAFYEKASGLTPMQYGMPLLGGYNNNNTGPMG